MLRVLVQYPLIKIQYVNSNNEVLNYFTQDMPNYRKLIKRKYEHSVANTYLLDNNIIEYRKHNRYSHGFTELLKNFISYMPMGARYLQSRLTN